MQSRYPIRMIKTVRQNDDVSTIDACLIIISFFFSLVKSMGY